VHADARLAEAVGPGRRWAVSILAESGLADADWLATPGRPTPDQLGRVPHERGELSGAAVLSTAPGWLECETDWGRHAPPPARGPAEQGLRLAGVRDRLGAPSRHARRGHRSRPDHRDRPGSHWSPRAPPGPPAIGALSFGGPRHHSCQPPQGRNATRTCNARVTPPNPVKCQLRGSRRNGGRQLKGG